MLSFMVSVRPCFVTGTTALPPQPGPPQQDSRKRQLLINSFAPFHQLFAVGSRAARAWRAWRAMGAGRAPHTVPTT